VLPPQLTWAEGANRHGSVCSRSASVNQVNGTNVLDAMDDVLMPAV
jgi:hypothetical protein